MDPEESIKVQEERIEYFKKKGGQQFTGDGRTAEITVDLVLQARAKMLENKANGPEDATVSETMEQSPQEILHHTTLSDIDVGLVDAPSSWRIVKLIFLRNQTQRQKKE